MTIRQLGKYDFTIRKGDTLRLPFLFGGTGFEPTDLTGWDAELVVKDFDDDSVLLSATTGNGKMIVDGPALTVTLLLTDTETDGYAWTRGKHCLKLIDTQGTGDAVTYLTGTACVVDDC